MMKVLQHKHRHRHLHDHVVEREHAVVVDNSHEHKELHGAAGR